MKVIVVIVMKIYQTKLHVWTWTLDKVCIE